MWWRNCVFVWQSRSRLKSLLNHLWQRKASGAQKNLFWLRKQSSIWERKKKRKIQGRGREAAVCQQPIESSLACLCWRYLHRFCWWYNSAYILHSSLPLLQAVFNTAQDTLCQLKRVPNADKTKFSLFTKPQTGQKRKNYVRIHTSTRLSEEFFSFTRRYSEPCSEVIQLNNRLHTKCIYYRPISMSFLSVIYILAQLTVKSTLHVNKSDTLKSRATSPNPTPHACCTAGYCSWVLLQWHSDSVNKCQMSVIGFARQVRGALFIQHVSNTVGIQRALHRQRRASERLTEKKSE